MHIWLGRLSFIFGISSTIIGLVTAWYERFEGVAFFPIAVSIGGTLQVIAQCLAIYYIRKKNVTKHLFWNHIVFFGGCLTPAIIRFEYLIQTEIPYWNLYSWAIILAVGLLSFRAFVYKTWY
ncbi:hypothetical protein K502DRAFT_322974 [Neoconidiobolus thromboides FSU 785]|nr:hypothetical protein K502DRAFT_322974 [Neoconidiobolus thromboides FSU 785]